MKNRPSFTLLLTLAVLAAPLAALAPTANASGSDEPALYATGVAASIAHTCVLTSVGNVDCYGNNDYGRATDYTLGDAVGVSAGFYHTCVLLLTGNVECYGLNASGQAADYTGGNAVAISAGMVHTCVLLSTGNVDCYGENGWGRAFDYTGGDAVGVSAGSLHTCVLLSNGNVDCYGYNNSGQAADYTTGNVVAVDAGYHHTCVLLSTGNVDCYGNNSYGRAADYTGENAIAVSADEFHTCVLLSTGNVDCYGLNHAGQSADYTRGDAVGVTAATFHTCVLTAAGDVDCYGENGSRQAADWLAPDVTPPTVTVPADITVDATGPEGATVTWTATATDNRHATLPVTCSPASGGRFAVGTTSVTCTATDGAGNTGSAGFTVTVLPVVPGAPRDLGADAGPGPLDATLSWNAPEWDGGASVAQYRVYRVTNGSETEVGNTTDESFVVPRCGLDETCTYVVRAENSVGIGAASDAADAPDVASPPTTGPVQVTTNDDGSTTVAVDADEDGTPEFAQTIPASP